MSSFGIFSKRICGVLKIPKSSNFGGCVAKYSKIWEPDYLILGMTKTPEYDKVNVQLKGYDWAVLEKFQKYIIKIARTMNIDISNKWAAPQQDLVIEHFAPNSSNVQYSYNLRLSERNVQVIDVKSHIMPLFIEAVLTTCPPGVNISFHEHEAHMEEDRYIPNLEIAQLENQLENLEKDKKKT